MEQASGGGPSKPDSASGSGSGSWVPFALAGAVILALVLGGLGVMVASTRYVSEIELMMTIRSGLTGPDGGVPWTTQIDAMHEQASVFVASEPVLDATLASLRSEGLAWGPWGTLEPDQPGEALAELVDVVLVNERDAKRRTSMYLLSLRATHRDPSTAKRIVEAWAQAAHSMQPPSKEVWAGDSTVDYWLIITTREAKPAARVAWWDRN